MPAESDRKRASWLDRFRDWWRHWQSLYRYRGGKAPAAQRDKANDSERR